MPENRPSSQREPTPHSVAVSFTEQQVELLTRIRDSDFEGKSIGDVVAELLRRRLATIGERNER